MYISGLPRPAARASRPQAGPDADRRQHQAGGLTTNNDDDDDDNSNTDNDDNETPGQRLTAFFIRFESPKVGFSRSGFLSIAAFKRRAALTAFLMRI